RLAVGHVYPVNVGIHLPAGLHHTSRVYKYVDMATIRGHNEVMVKTCRQMNTDIHRVHMAYRKALVPEASWEAFAMMDLAEVPTGTYGATPA
ncbi:MAG: hypothetical protein AAFN92_16380, partial [Bacteroidota bacterium]